METEAEIELLGVLTDMRAHYYRKGQGKETGLKSSNKPLQSTKARRVQSRRLNPKSSSRYSTQ